MKIDAALVEAILASALKRGADKAEVFAALTTSTAAESKGRAVEALERSVLCGFSLRVFRRGCLGFSYSTDFDTWQEVVDKALESAAWTEPDEYLDLPQGSMYPQVNIFDEELAAAGEDRLIDMAIALEDAALTADPRITRTRKARVTRMKSEILLRGSGGVACGYRSTSCSMQIMTVATEGQESQVGWEYEGARLLGAVSPVRTGRAAARRALDLLGARRITPGRFPVILDNASATDFLDVFASALSSENVQKGRSLLAGKEGVRVVSSRMNIVDNGLLEGKSGSRPFDAEGVPTRKNVPVKEGILQGFLYNVHTARKASTTSTGNAVRGGIMTLPGVGIANLFAEPVSTQDVCTRDGLFAMAGTGLLVTDVMGMHTANSTSGDFSVGVGGLWIEGGETVFPVKEAVISGNILDLFQKVEALGDDLKFYGSIGCPSLLIGDVDISG